MKNFELLLLVISFSVIVSASKLKTKISIPIEIQNAKVDDDRPLNIYIPTEVMSSLICKEIESLCTIEKYFLKKKYLNKTKISKDDKDSTPDFYYSECKNYNDYILIANLKKEIEKFINEKINSEKKKLPFSASRSSLAPIYFLI